MAFHVHTKIKWPRDRSDGGSERARESDGQTRREMARRLYIGEVFGVDRASSSSFTPNSYSLLRLLLTFSLLLFPEVKTKETRWKRSEKKRRRRRKGGG